MQQLSAKQLKEWLDDPARDRLDICRIAGVRPMPMRIIPARYGELKPEAETVVICHHGARSHQVCMFLEHQGFSKLFNLYGGMAAWSRDVDPATPTY